MCMCMYVRTVYVCMYIICVCVYKLCVCMCCVFMCQLCACMYVQVRSSVNRYIFACIHVNPLYYPYTSYRFFFPSNVLVHMEGEEDREMANVEQFVAIMDTYLQSFLQAEIELFRENLSSLQELNRRHKLFSKVHTSNI